MRNFAVIVQSACPAPGRPGSPSDAGHLVEAGSPLHRVGRQMNRRPDPVQGACARGAPPATDSPGTHRNDGCGARRSGRPWLPLAGDLSATAFMACFRGETQSVLGVWRCGRRGGIGLFGSVRIPPSNAPETSQALLYGLLVSPETRLATECTRPESRWRVRSARA